MFSLIGIILVTTICIPWN